MTFLQKLFIVTCIFGTTSIFSQTQKSEADSIIKQFLSGDLNVSSINYSGNEDAIKYTIQLGKGKKLNNKELGEIARYIHLNPHFNQSELRQFIKSYVPTPSTEKTVDLDYVIIQCRQIAEFRDKKQMDYANKLHKDLLNYINAIRIENSDLKKAKIYAEEHNLVLNIIQHKIDSGIELCQQNIALAKTLGDTSLLLMLNYHMCEFYVYKKKLDEFILLAESSLKMDSLREVKSDFYISNLKLLADAYIFSGKRNDRAIALLESLYKDPNSKIESYSLFAKFFAYNPPESDDNKKLFEILNYENLDTFFNATHDEAKANLYPMEFYHYLREFAGAFSNFGQLENSIDVLNEANFEVKTIYTENLAQELAAHDKEILEEKNALNLQHANEISQIYKKALVVIVFLLVIIGIILLTKLRQNRQLRLTNETINIQKIRKGILMKELNHRVKNNFQIVSSLISTQLRSITDEKTKEILKDSQSRINSMAINHERFYQTDYLNYDIGEYIDILFRDLKGIFGKGEEFQLKLDINNSLQINMDIAIPLGLIINELVTNSMKHSNIEEIVLSFTIFQTRDGINIQFTDSGLQQGIFIDLDTPQSMGTRLIKRLTRQISGDVTYKDSTYYFFIPNNIDEE